MFQGDILLLPSVSYRLPFVLCPFGVGHCRHVDCRFCIEEEDPSICIALAPTTQTCTDLNAKCVIDPSFSYTLYLLGLLVSSNSSGGVLGLCIPAVAKRCFVYSFAAVKTDSVSETYVELSAFRRSDQWLLEYSRGHWPDAALPPLTEVVSLSVFSLNGSQVRRKLSHNRPPNQNKLIKPRFIGIVPVKFNRSNKNFYGTGKLKFFFERMFLPIF